MRIIKASGLKPRRTIRVALWGAEEWGFLGSRAYVGRHFATRPEPPADLERGSEEYVKWMEKSRQTPPELKPDYESLSAYYNYDNGTGKIRGIYLQANEQARPIFEAWLAPFADMGMTTPNTCSVTSTTCSVWRTIPSSSASWGVAICLAQRGSPARPKRIVGPT